MGDIVLDHLGLDPAGADHIAADAVLAEHLISEAGGGDAKARIESGEAFLVGFLA
jgi:hypothetical protein